MEPIINWNWKELLGLSFVKGSLVLNLGPIIWIILALFGGFVIYRLIKFSRYEVVEATLSIGNIGQVRVKPNHDAIKVAYQAWVELVTRKAAVPFDEDHDLIIEIYDSWYELFQKLRELTKSIPAQRLRSCKSTNDLVDVMIKVLNNGLRPHLTEWQAKFRKWYEEQLSKHLGSPQEIQKTYPDYAKLVGDLKKVNSGLVVYSQWLRRIVQGDKSK